MHLRGLNHEGRKHGGKHDGKHDGKHSGEGEGSVLRSDLKILEMRMDGYSYSQIADETGTPLDEVGAAIIRAFDSLDL